MARTRKRATIPASEVLRLGNSYLLHSADKLAGERRGVACLLETVLLATGNYKGFRCLDADDMKKSEMGKSIGIIFDESAERKHQYPDDSRRSYYE